MRTQLASPEYAVIWAKVMFFIACGKAFVAGAGLGLAALGVVDLGSTLGIQPMVEFIDREHLLEVFSLGGGAVSLFAQIVWKIIGR